MFAGKVIDEGTNVRLGQVIFCKEAAREQASTVVFLAVIAVELKDTVTEQVGDELNRTTNVSYKPELLTTKPVVVTVEQAHKSTGHVLVVEHKAAQSSSLSCASLRVYTHRSDPIVRGVG